MKDKKSSAVAPKKGEQFITMNKGLKGEYDVKVLKRLPKNWKPIKGARTAPRGYVWVSNNKSLFGGQRKIALIKDKEYHKLFSTEVEPIQIKGQPKRVQPPKKERKAVTQADLNAGCQNFLKVKERLKSGEVRNLALKKPLRFYCEHSVDEAVKLLNSETKNGR